MLGQTKSMPGLGNAARVRILIGVAVLAAGVALLISPIAQDSAYHQFADRRAFLGIPNFADTASSIGFLIVGALGTAFVIGGPGRWLFDAPGERWPFLFFFAAVALVGAGSAYYHADPTTETLLWDRLPMTVAFMALLSAFITDRIHARLGVAVILPLLLAIGIGAVVYWYFSEAAGRGDLAPYALVQLFPLLAIPLICLLFPGRRTRGKHVVYLVLWYAVAKLCELFDGEIYALLGNTVSGHSLKHLMAAAAAAVMLAMLRRALPDLRREEPWTKNS